MGWFKKKKAEPTVPDRSTLVPRIKTHQFTAALKEMDIPADQLPYTEPLVADLLIAYAFDLPGMFQMASAEAVAELGIPKAELLEVAIANLKRELPELGYSEHGPVRRIVTGQNLEACTLLATTFWNQMASETEGEIVATVPSRDILVFTSSRSTEGIATLRELAAGVLEREATHGLTETLLVWRGGKWHEYTTER